jgi:hypothetical protein
LRGLIASIWLIPPASSSDVAAAGDRSYLDYWFHPEMPMPAVVSTDRLSRPLLLVALLCGVIMAATVSLWAYYGTSVFLEIVRTGWAACF